MELISTYNLHPSDVFDRDRVEFDMTVCYVELDAEDAKKVKIMHSEHFREVVKEDRGVIYSSFTELKEIAGIDELTINSQLLKSGDKIEKLNELVKRLLDDCDLVQALRIQVSAKELFVIKIMLINSNIYWNRQCSTSARLISTFWSIAWHWLKVW